MAFSNSPQNKTHATFRDLGFAAREDGKFDVYLAGGLGPGAKMGVKAAEAVEPECVLVCVDAMILVFTEFGNYENRAWSRSRFLQDRLGMEGVLPQLSVIYRFLTSFLHSEVPYFLFHTWYALSFLIYCLFPLQIHYLD